MAHKTKRNALNRQRKKRIKEFISLVKGSSFHKKYLAHEDGDYFSYRDYKEANNIYGTTNMSFHDFRKACILSRISIPTQSNKQCYVWQKY